MSFGHIRRKLLHDFIGNEEVPDIWKWRLFEVADHTLSNACRDGFFNEVLSFDEKFSAPVSFFFFVQGCPFLDSGVLQRFDFFHMDQCSTKT